MPGRLGGIRMNKAFAEIYGRLIDTDVTLTEPTEQLRRIGDFSDDLLEAMTDRLKSKDWPALTRLVHVAFLTPSPTLTPILCDLLDNYRDDAYMEAIADVLGDIRDERSIPSILRAINYHIWSDDDYHFNRKLIFALKQIGTTGQPMGFDSRWKVPTSWSGKMLLTLCKRADNIRRDLFRQPPNLVTLCERDIKT